MQSRENSPAEDHLHTQIKGAQFLQVLFLGNPFAEDHPSSSSQHMTEASPNAKLWAGIPLKCLYVQTHGQLPISA